MLNKKLKYFIVSCFCVLSLVAILVIRDIQFKSEILEQYSQYIDRHYKLKEIATKLSSVKDKPFIKENTTGKYKLVYETNFGCSNCMVKLPRIQELREELSKIHHVQLCLVSHEKSYKYMRFYLNRYLDNYDLCIIQQKSKNKIGQLFLVDSSNKIIMAGDYAKYPFLKVHYINSIQKSVDLSH